MSTPALFGVVLAAGSARRYGGTKQLAVLDDQPLVTRAVRELEAVCGARSLLVTGHAGDAVHAACAPLLGFRVHNERHADGMASSLAAAVRAVTPVAGGLLVTLADQPEVTREHLARLENTWRRDPQRAVASAYAGTEGVPAIIPRRLFAALLALEGDQGARKVLAGCGSELVTVPHPDSAFDIDRPADLDALQRSRNRRGA